MSSAESEAAFQAATVDLGVCFASDPEGNYTDSRTACLWRVWCAALNVAKPDAPLLAATKRLLDECGDDGITAQAVTQAREAIAEAESLLGGRHA